MYFIKPSILSIRREARFEERFLKTEQARVSSIMKEATTHGVIGSNWENNCIAVAAQGDGTEIITLCTFKGNMAEVLKYQIDCN